MEPGSYHGHAGVRNYLGRLGEIFEQQRAEPVDVIDVDAKRVISVIRAIGRSEKFGTEIDAEWAWLIRMRDGKGIEVWIFTDRAQHAQGEGEPHARLGAITAQRFVPALAIANTLSRTG